MQIQVCRSAEASTPTVLSFRRSPSPGGENLPVQMSRMGDGDSACTRQ